MNPLSNRLGSFSASAPHLSLPGALRRDLLGQHIVFRDALENYRAPDHDRLTRDLFEWLQGFKDALDRHEPEEALQSDFIRRLQGLLTDRAFLVLMDEDAHLGSDGYTYNKKALQVHLSNPINQNRSPMLPESPEPFIVILHPIVPVMVQWLKRKNEFYLNPRLEEDYRVLVESGNVPALPTPINERARQMQERLAQQRLQRERKREINATLVEFRLLLGDSPLRDPLTEQIRTWYGLFRRAVDENRDIIDIKSAFIADLQELLKDPLSLTILDEPYLGNDGYTYSKKCIVLYKDAAREPYCNRSPKLPDDDREFVVSAHPVAARMIGWLIEMGAHHPCQNIANLYEALIRRGNVPQLPTEENRDAAHLQARVIEQARQNDEENANFLRQQELLRAERYVRAGFVEVDQAIADNGVQLAAVLNENRQLGDAQQQLLDQRIAAAENELQESRRRMDALDEHIRQLDVRSDRVDRLNTQLAYDIEVVRQEIKERDKGWLSSLGTTIAIIGACALASALLGPTGATLTPLQKGAMFAVRIPL